MRVSYYDVVLGLIPATLLVVSGSLYSAGVDYTTAVPVGGLMAVLIVGHALFIRALCPKLIQIQSKRLISPLNSLSLNR